MAEDWGQIAFFVLVSLVMVIILLIIKYMQYQKEQFRLEARQIVAHHQDDIYSISGRVQGEEQQHSSQDAYLSIDHINISNQLNKPNYDDAPPSYEEAMRIAVAASLSSSSSEVPTVVVVPKTTN